MTNIFLTFLGAILGAALFIAAPTVRNALFPPPPIVEFIGTPVVEVNSRDPGRRDVVYQMRRNEACETIIHIRWFSIDRGAFDTSLTRDIVSTRAPVTTEFVPFTITIPVPKTPGQWAYAPLVKPSVECHNLTEVAPPLAVVKVPPL